MSVRSSFAHLKLATLISAAVLNGSHAASSGKTPDYTAEKVRLLGEALDSRDRGDLLAAKRSIEQLSVLVGNDPIVQRLKAEIEAKTKALEAAATKVSEQSKPLLHEDIATVAPSDDSLDVTKAIQHSSLSPSRAQSEPSPAAITHKRVSFLSTSTFVGRDEKKVRVSFSVEGVEPRMVLVRGIGPGLKDASMKKGYLKDPLIKLIDSAGKTVASNSDWGKSVDGVFMNSMVNSGGGVPFNGARKDAAIVSTLAPGRYSVTFEGLREGTGVGVLEIYQFTP